LTNGMLGIFDEVLDDVDEDPITYATIKGIADAVSTLINLASGVGSTNPLPILEVLETLGIEVDADVIDASSEVYLAIAAADPTTLTSVEALETLVATAVTAANTFELTVVNGSLSGGYVSDTTVTVVANSAPEGQYFAGWTGADVADSTAPVTTLTMPAAAATVTATFQDIPAPKFNLTVTSGTGGGSYEAGQQITISAGLPAEGKIFDRWTGGDGVIDNPTNSVATLVMPANALTVTATYIDDPNQLFGLNVGSGTGSGQYKAGERVAIAANAAPDRKRFDRWGGDVQYIDNATDPNTRVTLPRDSVTVVARYIDIPEEELPQTLTITNGEGGGDYLPGTAVTISADVPEPDQLFDRWLGDVAYVANVNDATTTVLMPAQAVSLRASYRAAPPTEYALTVEGGTGDGEYVAGDVVTIAAGLAPAGQVFDQWIGQTARVANVNQPTTTITMPDSAVSVRAVYKDLPPQTFALTVDGGTGSGDYTQGRVVAIAAAPAAADKVFERWEGQTAALANVNQPNTTLTMPGTAVTVRARYADVPAEPATPTLRTGGRGGRGGSIPGDGFLMSQANAKRDWSAESGLVMRGQSVGRQVDVELIEQPVPAGTLVFIEAPDEPTGFYFDKWIGQTAFVDNIHQPRTSVLMPNHDVTVLAQYRSFDGTTTVTLAANQVSGTAQTLPAGAAGTEVELKVEPAVTIGGRPFIFDFWEGQTATVANVLLPETTVRLSNTDVALRPVYRAKPAGTVAVTAPAGTTIPADIEPGSYINLSAPTPAQGLTFERWTGQTGTVETLDAEDSRLYVGVNAITLTAQFVQGADPEAVAELVESTTPPANVDVYTDAGASDAEADNLSAYNDALAALRAAATNDAPLTIEAVREMVTTFNTILSAAAGNTAPSLDAAGYAKVGVTVPAAAVDLLNNGVASAEAKDVDTVAELQAIADAADRITTLASAGTGAPTAADYSAVGINDVVAANASAYNSAVAEVKPATPADIQAVITAYNSVLAGAGNVATAANLTAAVYAELGVTVPATALGLLNSAVGSQGAAASNTVAKLQAMVSASAKVINTAANSQDAGLTESDFTVLGVQGVTPANVADASGIVADAAVTEVDTVAKLQALLSEVLTPPLPVPTLSLWSLLLMVMLMMGLGLRQRALRSKF